MVWKAIQCYVNSRSKNFDSDWTIQVQNNVLWLKIQSLIFHTKCKGPWWLKSYWQNLSWILYGVSEIFKFKVQIYGNSTSICFRYLYLLIKHIGYFFWVNNLRKCIRLVGCATRCWLLMWNNCNLPRLCLIWMMVCAAWVLLRNEAI